MVPPLSSVLDLIATTVPPFSTLVPQIARLSLPFQIARDQTGIPDVLVRSSSVAQEVGVAEPLPEDPLDYNS